MKVIATMDKINTEIKKYIHIKVVTGRWKNWMTEHKSEKLLHLVVVAEF